MKRYSTTSCAKNYWEASGSGINLLCNTLYGCAMCMYQYWCWGRYANNENQYYTALKISRRKIYTVSRGKSEGRWGGGEEMFMQCLLTTPSYQRYVDKHTHTPTHTDNLACMLAFSKTRLSHKFLVFLCSGIYRIFLKSSSLYYIWMRI